MEVESSAAVKRARPLQIDSLHTANKLFVTAGAEMVLEVHGANFGKIANPTDTTQRSRIQFINADTVGGLFLYDVHRSDVLFWGDSLIRVRIAA